MRRLFLSTLLFSAVSGTAFAQFEVTPKDPIIGTKWTMLGVNRQKINELTFRDGGKVKCKEVYKNATWARVDKDHILFGYGPGSPYVVFRVSNEAGTEMKGYTYDGRVRYIQKAK